MTTTTLTELADRLTEPHSLARLESRTRRTFRRRLETHTAVEELETRARLLELTCAVVAVLEAIDEARLRTVGDLAERFDEIVRSASMRARLEPLEALLVTPEAQQILGAQPHPGPHELLPPVRIEEVVPVVRAGVSLVRIEEIEQRAAGMGAAEVGHRCRVAYDWLRAFVRRHDPAARESFRIVGRAYAEGRLRLPEVAHLLGFAHPDAVAWLEENGYARGIEALVLSEDHRTAALAKIREDRRARAGRPELRPALVVRDVLATQRIEEIDARRWLRLEA